MMGLGSVPGAAKAKIDYSSYKAPPDPERELQAKQATATRKARRADEAASVQTQKQAVREARAEQTRVVAARKLEDKTQAKPVVNGQGQTTGRIVNTTA
jgi:hypothetical protein